MDRRRARATRGFTLVELLVVMSVLSILASLVMFAMFGAQERAREARTRATINKLNAIIMPMYHSYQTRRVPIPRVTPGMSDVDAKNAKLQAYRRLQALRELMKMEMPDRFTDITGDSQILKRNGQSWRSSLARQYKRRFDRIGDKRDELFESAECLYLIITSSTTEDAGRTHFSQKEVGDVDEDGLPEFLDGWGRPISFIRWPAGFNSSLQPFAENSGFREGDEWGSGPYHDWKESHDPFDSRKLEEKAYAIYPLIYSAGGDGIADVKSFVKSDRKSDPYPATNDGLFGLKRIDPYLSKQTEGPFGRQWDKPKDGKHWFDNIHNHELKGELR